MPCCMMGAIFFAQCLAVLAWVKRRLGFSEKIGQARPGVIGIFRLRPKVIMVILGFELLAGGSVFAYLEILPHQNYTHDQHSMHAEHSFQAHEG